MIERADPRPVVELEDGQPGRVELVLAGHDPKEMRKTFLSEHRMSVGVSQLKIEMSESV